VEELDCVQARLLRIRNDDRNREVEGFGADCGKLGSEAIAFEEGLQQLRSKLRKRRIRIEARRRGRNSLRHVQSAIRRGTVAKSLGKAGGGRLPACADEFHAATSSSLTAITFTPSDATGAR